MSRSPAIRSLAKCLVAAGVLCGAIFAGAWARAGVDPESNTDGFNPAAELYDAAEAQRLARVARQLELNDIMAWSAAYGAGSLWGPPLGGPPIRQPIGYESKQVGPNKWIYRPLYAGDVPPPDAPAGQGPAAGSSNATNDLPAPQSAPDAGPRRPAPSDAAPGDFVPPNDLVPTGGVKKPVSHGPREF